MVTVEVPGGAVADAVKLATAELPVPVGVKATVTPDGNPDAVKVTDPEKPSRSVTVIVSVAVLPCVTLTVEDDSAIAKFGIGKIP